MKFTHFILSLASTGLFTTNVDAFANDCTQVFCTKLADSDAKVCAIASYSYSSSSLFPSPSPQVNGATSSIVGGYSTYAYTIVKGLMEGETFTGNSVNDAGILIDVVRDGSTCNVGVTLNGMYQGTCNTCEYCG